MLFMGYVIHSFRLIMCIYNSVHLHDLEIDGSHNTNEEKDTAN